MNSISFFNHWHNGDLFSSKEYIRQVYNELDNSFRIKYYHRNHPKILQDIPIEYPGNLNLVSYRKKQCPQFLLENKNLFVNTWASTYYRTGFETKLLDKGGLNYSNFNIMWEHIFKKINEVFNTDIQIKSKEEYIPSIDYSVFNCKSINSFLKDNRRKKILICNNVPKSNQSFPSDMKLIISKLSDKFRDIDFICTNTFDTGSQENILFTDNIIKTNNDNIDLPEWCKSRCDLNEISYLSKFCDIIIGKNSGPYIFTVTKDSLMDENKTYIQFNHIARDSLFYDIDFKCRYIQQSNFDEQSVFNTIEKTLIDYT